MSRLTFPCRVDILQLFVTRDRATEMWRRLWKPLAIVLPLTAIVLAVLYIAYRLVDPLPPRHLKAQTGADSSSIRDESPKLNLPCGYSRLHAHSKSICSDSESICAWFKKI